MKKEIIFKMDYDFSDEYFDKIKDDYLLLLKSSFNNRYDQARNKKTLVEKEFNELKKQHSMSLEQYGKILLNSLDEHYELRSKSIKEIITDFNRFTMDSNLEWLERYSKAINDKETEFDFMGEDASTMQGILMSSWLKDNPDFEIDPVKNPRCFFDLTKKEGNYYFERLAEYQAGKEYFEIIRQLNDCLVEDFEEFKEYFDALILDKKSTIKWTGGSSKTRQLEFIKLVYALHNGGMINNGKGAIFVLLRDLAHTFGVELSRNYRSNLSKHLSYQNEGHDPLAFFEDLKDGFKKYLKYKR